MCEYAHKMTVWSQFGPNLHFENIQLKSQTFYSETYYGKVFVSYSDVNLRGIRRDYNFDSNLFLHP